MCVILVDDVTDEAAVKTDVSTVCGYQEVTIVYQTGVGRNVALGAHEY